MNRRKLAFVWMMMWFGLAGCVADRHPPPLDPTVPAHDGGGSGGGGSM